MLFLASSGSEALLNVLMAEYNSVNVVVHLFKNDYSPSWNSVLADFVESDFDGYAPQNVAQFFFQGFAGQIGYMLALDSNTFLVGSGTTPPQVAYGYWIQDAAGDLLWAERDPDGPVDMSSFGNQYQIYPRLGLSNCPP